VSQEDSIQKIQNQGKPEVREALKNDLIAELNAPVASGTLFFTLLGYLKDAEVIDPYTKKQGYTQLQSKIRFAPITFEFEPEHTPAFKEQYRSCQLAWILQSLSENSECSLLHLFRGDSSVSLEHQGAQYKKEAFYCLDEHLLEEPITLKMRKKIYEQLNQVYRPVGSKIVLGGSITEVESPLGTARPTSKWVRQHSDEGIRSPTPLPANGYARATASVQIGFVTASPQPEGRPRSDMTGLGSQVRTSWGQPANNQEQPRESICSRVCSCIVFRDRGVDTRVDGYAAID
jgi:hypothetical protein